MHRALPLRTLVVTAAFLAFAAGNAMAQGGINLSWQDCGASGALSRTFACTTNGTVGTIYGSVIPPQTLDQLNGEESEALVQTNQLALSNWWHYENAVSPNPAGCRNGALVFSMDFTANSNCSDPWGGQGFGGLDWQSGYGSPSRGRLRTAGAIAGSTQMANDQEWYVWKVTILGSKSVGTGACAGCTDGACILFTSQKLTEPLGVGDYIITSPISHQFVLFQESGNLGGQCFNNDPVQNRTWGSVKSLYR